MIYTQIRILAQQTFYQWRPLARLLHDWLVHFLRQGFSHRPHCAAEGGLSSCLSASAPGSAGTASMCHHACLVWCWRLRSYPECQASTLLSLGLSPTCFQNALQLVYTRDFQARLWRWHFLHTSGQKTEAEQLAPQPRCLSPGAGAKSNSVFSIAHL